MQTTCHTLLSVKIYLYFFKDGLLDHIYLKVCGSPYLEIFGFTVKCWHSLWFHTHFHWLKPHLLYFVVDQKPQTEINRPSHSQTRVCIQTIFTAVIQHLGI